MIFGGWATPLTLLQLELIQRDYEGHPVPEDLKGQIAALDDEKDAMNFEAVDTLYRALDELPRDPNFAYVQPNDLEEIRRERPDGPRQLGGLAETDLLDKFHGAWTSRNRTMTSTTPSSPCGSLKTTAPASAMWPPSGTGAYPTTRSAPPKPRRL